MILYIAIRSQIYLYNQETYYAYAEVDPLTRSALAALSDLILRLNLPAIIANTAWGELSKSETGEKVINNFICDFRDFCEFLSSKTSRFA